MSFIPVFAVLSTMAATAMGHGIVVSGSANGVSVQGYDPEFQWTDPNAQVAGWNTPANIEWGYIDPTGYQSPDIICHMGATNAQKSITVEAGNSVTVKWNKWPEGHHGPVIDYLASCNGECSTVDKNQLKFVKIAEKGLVDNSFTPGRWASDELISNGNSWQITVPKDLKAGEYVLRHEIIAHHASHEPNGAQNYPQCLNLKVTGGGNSVPQGIPATELYKASDPGIALSIHEGLKEYIIPGPAIWTAGNQQDNGKDTPTPKPAPQPVPSTPSTTPKPSPSVKPVELPAKYPVEADTPAPTPAPAPAPSAPAEHPHEDDEVDEEDYETKRPSCRRRKSGRKHRRHARSFK